MNKLSHIAYCIGIRQVSVFHFCDNFGISISKHVIIADYYPDTILSNELIKFLFDNKIFLQKYNEDYYSDKNPDYIAKLLNRDSKEVDLFLRNKCPSYYISGYFLAPGRYSLRYISSYKLDLEMGCDYSHLAFQATKILPTFACTQVTNIS